MRHLGEKKNNFLLYPVMNRSTKQSSSGACRASQENLQQEKIY
jgi:hypothetical protein